MKFWTHFISYRHASQSNNQTPSPSAPTVEVQDQMLGTEWSDVSMINTRKLLNMKNSQIKQHLKKIRCKRNVGK